MLLTKSWLTAMTVSIMMLILTKMMSLNNKKNMQKKYEFECGFNSISSNRMPFSSQFFMVTIMFLVFDLEISMVMPVSTEMAKSQSSMVAISVLIIVMTVGMLSEWAMGSLEWSK